MDFNLFNFLAIFLGVISIELVFHQSRIKKAKEEILNELTNLLENSDEIIITKNGKEI